MFTRDSGTSEKMKKGTQTLLIALVGILAALVITTDAAGCTAGICKNNGKCKEETKDNVVVGYNCSCRPGYKGVNCEEKIKPCDPNPCQRGAKCSIKGMGNNQKDYSCDCAIWWTAQDCSRHDVSLTILVATCVVVFVTVLFIVISLICNARKKKQKAQDES